MDIQLKNLQKKTPLNLSQIKKIVNLTLSYLDVPDATLSFAFVTNAQIKSLNKKFLGRSYETDVLSFDLSDDSKHLSGEVIVSVDMAVKNARRFKNDLRNEVALCVVHGILHLLGYDDHHPHDIKRMRKKEQEILLRLGNKILNITA